MASPLSEAPNTSGSEKVGRFLTNKSVYLGNGARYGQETIPSYRMLALSMTFSDPNPHFQGYPTVQWRMLNVVLPSGEYWQVIYIL